MRQANVLSVGLVCLGFAACTPPPPFDVGESAAAIAYPFEPVTPSARNQSPDYGASPTTGIADRGGPVISSTTVIQFLFYGSVPGPRQTLFENFFKNLDGSPLARVLTTFEDGSGARPNGRFVVKPSIQLGRPQGNTITDFGSLITNAVGPVVGGNTIFVITGDATTGAVDGNSSFCPISGWHNSIGARPIYAFIGQAGACGNSLPSVSPNGDPIADAMINTMWHEVAEAITDPQPLFSPGFKALQSETADLCMDFLNVGPWSAVGYAQWDQSFFVGGAGSGVANVNVGGANYLVQPIWQNLTGGGGCVSRLVANRPSVATSAATPVGDFDGDGTTDLLFHNYTNTDVHTLRLGTGTGVGSPQLLGGASISWNLYGVADFDGDGVSDLLWRNQDNGAISVWVNGTPHHLTESSLDDWVIRGVGDFDYDSEPANKKCADILFQSMSTNKVHIWLNDCSLQPIGLIGNSNWATSIQMPSTSNMDTVGIGAFGPSSNASVLWHPLSINENDDTHVYKWWQMNGRQATSFDIDASRFDFVLGLADVHGNGQAELIAEDSSHANVVWADAAPGNRATVIAPVLGHSWRYAGSGTLVMSGIKWGALFWQNRTNGQIQRWVLNPTTGVRYQQQTLALPTVGGELVAF